MDSSLSSLPLDDSVTRHTHSQTQTQTRLQPFPQNHVHVQYQPEQPPPSKRRRSNSVNPAIPSNTDSPTTFSPSAHWQSRQTHAVLNHEHNLDPTVQRSNSSGQVSRASTTSDQPLAGPQLRKKPKSSSIKNTNILRAAATAILKSPSLPTFHAPSQTERDATQPLVIKCENPGPPISRANSGTSQHQSPNQKRPPASHSSYGVETTCGPPPSYSTQRTFSQERIRKIDRNSQTRMQQASSEIANIIALDDTQDTSSNPKENAPSLAQSSPDTADTNSIPTPTETEHATGVRIRGEQRASMEDEQKAPSSDGRRSEDLFLNIARVDAARPSQPQTEKRRSRISIPFLPSNRSSQAARSSPTRTQHEPNTSATPRTEFSSFHSKRASIHGQVAGASSSRGHLADGIRFREQNIDSYSDAERYEPQGYNGLRRSSTTNMDATRLAHRSSAGLRSSRLVSESIQLDHPRISEHIATESTVSTTAPSTVWDELDDLKSRIRKLELTGKLPSSSTAAISLTDRPRTATTAATTMSTSPKYKAAEPNLPPNDEGRIPSPYPLLNEAMENAKAVVSQDVFQKLQSTAQDALQLSAMFSDRSSGRGYPASLANDRQLKRRTESLCRGLTELAIALAAEAKPTQSSTRPGSREQSLPPNSMLRSRRYSNDPADRNHAPARVQSRLDSRRTSLHLGRGGTGYSSPERGSYPSPGGAAQMSDPRLNRSSTLLRKRGQGSFDGADDGYETSPSIRPGSRAMTDLGAYRRLSRDQMMSPREYTSQHPLPSQQEQAAAIAAISPPSTSAYNSNITFRRKYAPPASVVGGGHDHTPITPREAWGRMSMAPTDTQSPDVVSEVGGATMQGSSRRSLGFASRIGTSVGSRLRAARTDRNSREDIDMRGDRSMAAPMHIDHPARAFEYNSQAAQNA